MRGHGVWGAIHGALIRTLPRGFRARNGAELADTFVRLCASRSGRALHTRALRECVDLLVLTVRLRIGGTRAVARPVQRRARAHEAIIRDARYAAKTMIRMPGFSVPALATMTLGIGAVTAIFTLAWGLWLKPLPYEDPRGLVSVQAQFTSRRMGATLSAPETGDYGSAPSLAGLAAYHYGAAIVDDWGEPVRLVAYGVTHDLFEVLGVRPVLGRSFAQDDLRETPGSFLILSHRIWRQRFNADPGVIGRELRMRGRTGIIVGVMPAGFEFPFFQPSDFWYPFDLNAYGADRRARGVMAIGRLRPDAPIERLRTELSAISDRLAGTYPDSNEGWAATATPLIDQTVGRYRTAFSVLLGMVGLLLCIAAANILGLFIARHTTREHELTVRAALGAGARDLRRLITIEGLILACAGCVLGVIAAVGLSSVASEMLPPTMPRVDALRVSAPVFGVSAGVSLLIGLLCGFTADAVMGEARIGAALRAGGRGLVGSGRQRLRSGLVIGEVALSLMLLASAGLMARSFVSLMRMDRGFEPRRLLTLHLTLPFSISDASARADLMARVVERLEALPDVESAATVNGYPSSSLGVLGGGGVVAADRREQPPVAAVLRAASPGYFETMGTPVLSGREFQSTDRIGAPPVAIVAEPLARELWPGESAIGKRLRLASSMSATAVGETVEVIGVVGDMRLASTMSPDLFIPSAQAAVFWTDIVLRTAGDPEAVGPAVRSAVHEVDPLLLIEGMQPMTSIIGDRLALERTQSVLAGMFGLLATLLAAVGLYGLLAHIVQQRIREIGVRRALGAHPSDIFRTVLARGMVLAAIGLAAGALGAVTVHRLLSTRVFGLDDLEPGIFGASVGLLLGVAFLACCVPALRAVRVDPLEVLR